MTFFRGKDYRLRTQYLNFLAFELFLTNSRIVKFGRVYAYKIIHNYSGVLRIEVSIIYSESLGPNPRPGFLGLLYPL